MDSEIPTKDTKAPSSAKERRAPVDGRKKHAPALPIYQAIKNRLREQIVSGVLKPGGRVPSEQELAVSMNVSRGQARQALRDLEMEGFLERFPGRGSFVAQNPGKPPEKLKADFKALMFMYSVLARDDGNRYVRNMVDGFGQYVHEHRYHPTFHYIDLKPEAELQFLRQVEHSGFGGLAIWPTFRSDEERHAIKHLASSRFPCVVVDCRLPEVDCDFVGTANRLAFEKLTAALIARGHRRVGYVARDLARSVMEDRFQGYRNALEAADLPYDDGLANFQGRNSAVLIPFLQSITAGSSSPTAFVCSDNWTAEKLLEGLQSVGLSVPQDVELALMDDTLDPDHSSPLPWLTAVQDGAELGRTIAQLLLARIAQPDKCLEHRYIRPRFLFDLVR